MHSGMIELSPVTIACIEQLYRDEDQARAVQLLENKCGDDLPGVDASYAKLAERIRFAVLRLSNGDIEQLEKEVEDACKDWRDTLVTAGFANGIDAHLNWTPREGA